MTARILVVEDNRANLDLMTFLLQAFGHTALTAADGLEGLAAAQREVPDLIVCDVQLPKASGYEVARQLKADPALQGVPLVAVTAFAMVGDRDKLLAAGFDGYIAKPIDPEAFVGQIEAFLPPELHSAPPARGRSEPTTAVPVSRRERILVVDNQPVNLDLMQSLLAPLGYEVLTAGSMTEGLAVARQARPDLILSDVGMADGSGYDFIRLVKADPQLAGIPFVFITATHPDEAARAKGLALGAAQFLFRPADPEAVLAAVQACLARREVP